MASPILCADHIKQDRCRSLSAAAGRCARCRAGFCCRLIRSITLVSRTFLRCAAGGCVSCSDARNKRVELAYALWLRGHRAPSANALNCASVAARRRFSSLLRLIQMRQRRRPAPPGRAGKRAVAMPAQAVTAARPSRWTARGARLIGRGRRSAHRQPVVECVDDSLFRARYRYASSRIARRRTAQHTVVRRAAGAHAPHVRTRRSRSAPQSGCSGRCIRARAAAFARQCGAAPARTRRAPPAARACRAPFSSLHPCGACRAQSRPFISAERTCDELMCPMYTGWRSVPGTPVYVRRQLRRVLSPKALGRRYGTRARRYAYPAPARLSRTSYALRRRWRVRLLASSLHRAATVGTHTRAQPSRNSVPRACWPGIQPEGGALSPSSRTATWTGLTRSIPRPCRRLGRMSLRV